jgi:hypothetical protein
MVGLCLVTTVILHVKTRGQLNSGVEMLFYRHQYLCLQL